MIYSILDIEKTFKQRNWWDLIFNLFLSKYITYFIANNTKLTPNQITLLSFIFAVFSGIAFYFHFFILGAFLYQFSYILDIVDGSLARVKKISSKFGAFFDVFTDWIKAPFLLVLLFMLLGEYNWLIVILMLLFLNCVVNKYNDMLFFTGNKSITTGETKEVITSKSLRFLEKMKEWNIQPFPAIVEFEAILLFLYPIFKINFLIYIAVIFLVFNFLLKFYAILKKIK